MIADIMIAFVIALIIRMFSLTSKYLKYIVVITMCITLITIYLNHGCTIGFIGEMDLAIWIVFIIIFDIALDLLEIGITYVLKRNKNNHIKE